MARTRSKLVLFLLAVLLVPLLVLLAEGVVRIFVVRIDPVEVFVPSPELRGDLQGAVAAGWMESDPQLGWRLKGGLRGVSWNGTPVSTNAAHLPMERELGAKRGVRVVCAGDWGTFGGHLPVRPATAEPRAGEAAGKSFAQRLEQRLREHFPGRDMEVLPLECPGYSSAQGQAWLRRDLAELQPDVVVACFGPEDVRTVAVADRAMLPQGGQGTVRGLMARSQLLLFIARNAQAKRAPLVPPPPEPRVSEAEYVQNFAAMGEGCREQGAQWAIVLPPDRYPGADDAGKREKNPRDPEAEGRLAAYRGALSKDAQEQKVPVLENLEIPKKGSGPASENFEADWWTQRVAEFLAPIMAEQMK